MNILKKINFIRFSTDIDNTISEKSIFDFHLAHQTNLDFAFEPKENTSKIPGYLSSSNLLSSINEIDISKRRKNLNSWKSKYNKNYPEDLFEIYKRFQFNINQPQRRNTYKSLSKIEARALIIKKFYWVRNSWKVKIT